MNDLQKGKTFTDTPPGNTVTAADLNSLVDNATILPAFVGEKPAASPDPADYLLIYQASTAQFCKVTAAQLIALAPVPPDAPVVPVIVGSAAPGPAFQSGDFAWIKTGGDHGSPVNGLKLWSADTASWEPAYTQPRLSVVRYLGDTGAPYFDPSGLGAKGRWKGWALCNGLNGTPNLNTASEVYLQLVA